MNCSDVNCIYAQIKDQPNFCDDAEVGQIKSDESSEHNENNSTTSVETGSHTFLNISSLAAKVVESGDIEGTIMSFFENLDVENLDVDLSNGVIEGEEWINIGKSIEHFFDAPVALYRHDGTILACSVFTKVEDEAVEDTTTDVATASDASRADYVSVAWVVALASAIGATAFLN